MERERIKPVTAENVNTDVKEILSGVKQKLGIVPNLYFTLANSPEALAAYLSLSDYTKKGKLSKKLGEQIAVLVAQMNGCDYCLSAHSKIAKGLGVNQEELNKNRHATSEDSRTEHLLKFARKITESRGEISDGDLETLREEGITDQEILEIVLHITLNTLSNYVNKIAETKIDFPKVLVNDLAVN